MEFTGTIWLPFPQLGISQLYLDEAKLEAVKGWFRPSRIGELAPLPVHDFGSGRYTLTDGHTRAFAAVQAGLTHIPVRYDADELVAGETGRRLYAADIAWCDRFRLKHVGDLSGRILPHSQYQKRWIGRCDRSDQLLSQTSEDERSMMQRKAPGLYLYGANADLTVLYFENAAGDLFVYENGALALEQGLHAGRDRP